jgi:hypothetical protein
MQNYCVMGINENRKQFLFSIQDRSGQGIFEYIIILLCVAIVVLFAVKIFGKAIRCQFFETTGQLDSNASNPNDCPNAVPDDDTDALTDPPVEPPEEPPAPPPPCGTFNSPSINGLALDRCLYFATQCEKPAADKFCESKGCGPATSFDVTDSLKTSVIGDGKACDATHCAPKCMCRSLSTVTCSAPKS